MGGKARNVIGGLGRGPPGRVEFRRMGGEVREVGGGSRMAGPWSGAGPARKAAQGCGTGAQGRAGGRGAGADSHAEPGQGETKWRRLNYLRDTDTHRQGRTSAGPTQ